jgi:hypothetical protein
VKNGYVLFPSPILVDLPEPLTAEVGLDRKTNHSKEVRKEMRKILLIPLIVCMVALLPTLSLPAVHATPQKTISTLADNSIPDPNVESWVAGDNIIIHQWGGGGNLLGPPGFQGIWIHDEWQVVHLADGIVTIQGVWDTPHGVIFYDEGDIYEGSVHVRYQGTFDMYTGIFQGTWAIISSTGDLANLRGGGTMWSAPPSPLLYGSMHYHFDP